MEYTLATEKATANPTIAMEIPSPIHFWRTPTSGATGDLNLKDKNSLRTCPEETSCQASEQGSGPAHTEHFGEI